MSDVYKLTEIVGTSNQSAEAAIQAALDRAKKTLRAIRWFHVTDTRGYVGDDGTVEFQVTLKIGFAIDD